VHLLTYPPHRKGLLLFFSLFFPGVLVVIWFFGFNVASLAERSELLARGWHLFLEHPWLGIGPGQFFHYPPTPGGHLTHPHNTLLGLLAEQGILGVAAFALFFVHLIRRNWLLFQTYRAQDTPLGWVSRSLLYVNLTFIINGLTDYNLGSTVMLLWYAIHWAVLARLPLPWETQGSFEPRPR
jgi:O-antigen ligase